MGIILPRKNKSNVMFKYKAKNELSIELFILHLTYRGVKFKLLQSKQFKKS